jgi:hypothetical protein
LVQYLRHTYGGRHAPEAPAATTIATPAHHIVGNPPATRKESPNR